MDNHATRPEVRAGPCARAKASGEHVSVTLHAAADLRGGALSARRRGRRGRARGGAAQRDRRGQERRCGGSSGSGSPDRAGAGPRPVERAGEEDVRRRGRADRRGPPHDGGGPRGSHAALGTRRALRARSGARSARRKPGDDAGRAARGARPAAAHPRGDARGRRRGRSRRAHRPHEPGASLDASPRRRRDRQAAHRDRAPRGARHGRRPRPRGARTIPPVEIELPGPQAAPPARPGRPAVGRRSGAAPRVRRRDRAAPSRVAPPGLRGQRVARASHADRRGPVGDRDLADRRPRGSRPRRTASSTSSSATRSASRASSRTCSSCRSSSRTSSSSNASASSCSGSCPIVLALFRERAEKKGVRLGAGARRAGSRRSRAIRGPSSTSCRTWSTTPSSIARRAAASS